MIGRKKIGNSTTVVRKIERYDSSVSNSFLPSARMVETFNLLWANQLIRKVTLAWNSLLLASYHAASYASFSFSSSPFARIPYTNKTHTRINWWNLSMEWSRFRLCYSLWCLCACAVYMSPYTHVYVETHAHIQLEPFLVYFTFFSLSYRIGSFCWFWFDCYWHMDFISFQHEFQHFSPHRIYFVLLIKVATSSAWINSARNVHSTKIEGKCIRPIDFTSLSPRATSGLVAT